MKNWKILNKYMSIYSLPENDDFLHYIDLILWYHKKHLSLRKKIKNYFKKYEPINNGFDNWIKENNIIQKQNKINFYIKSYFILIIIEIAKYIEGNSKFKEDLNNNISIQEYERFYRKDCENNKNKVRKIENISEKITHFRDSCVHNEDLGISNYPVQILGNGNIKGYNVYKSNKKIYLELDGINLKFITEGLDQNRCFVIGYGIITFDELKKIIKFFLDYFYKHDL